MRRVRKHRAPKGALRHDGVCPVGGLIEEVRKHRAPKGALRHRVHGHTLTVFQGQKAPSAKRCIKTVVKQFKDAGLSASESTERQKVH